MVLVARLCRVWADRSSLRGLSVPRCVQIVLFWESSSPSEECSGGCCDVGVGCDRLASLDRLLGLRDLVLIYEVDMAMQAL